MARLRDSSGRFKKKELAAPAAPEGKKKGEDGAPAGPSDHFLAELQASWSRHGAQTIETVRNDRPQDYLRLMASSLAKQAEGKGDAIEAMSDDEIADELRHILGHLAAAGADSGTGA